FRYESPLAAMSLNQPHKKQYISIKIIPKYVHGFTQTQ
ncbi:MAG: hypothetical protein ACI952_002317, partial [Flavobacteriales bacterium]